MAEEKPKFGKEEQYEMLKRCSEKKDITEWNQWRIDNPEENVLLGGTELNDLCLKDVLLNTGEGEWRGKRYKFIGKVCLNQAHLEGANLESAHLEDAFLWQASLGGAELECAHLEGACLDQAQLDGAFFGGAHLEGANLSASNIKASDFEGAHLQNACFQWAKADGETFMSDCKVDKYITNKNEGTDFSGVALESIRIDSGTKQLLEYNIRRKNWENWYEKHTKFKWLVQPFWLLSDYGISTGRIIRLFFAFALFFAILYYICGAVEYYFLEVENQPGIIANLFTYPRGTVKWWLVPLRAIYFSIVTMTTLGFGDIYANEQGVLGYILLMFQVLLGYVFLGALVTRFAVLFTTGGPAGEFEAIDEKTKQLLAEIEAKKRKANFNRAKK